MLGVTQKCLLASAFLLGMTVSVGATQANGFSFQVLTSFDTSGLYENPWGGVIEDTQGNLYGTTWNGNGDGGADGNIFKLAPDGTLTDLHDFQGGIDGSGVQTDLLMDASGNLYGTTYGFYNGAGNGNVFELSADGTYTVLHSFAGGATDGAHPSAGLVMDQSGNLYGTTTEGGPHNDGTVFKLAPDGTMTILHSFTYAVDGDGPQSRLIADSSGNLYGTTYDGGIAKRLCGTVFKVAPDGTFTSLYNFGAKGSDGCNPTAGLVMDAAGNLYGTTYHGGSGKQLGAVFKLAPNGTETILYAFKSKGKYGKWPMGALVMDAAGNLYGTAQEGGSKTINDGEVFEITAAGVFSQLHVFTGTDGNQPYAALYLDQSGNLFGTTFYGGTYDVGTVFELSPAHN